MVTVSNVLDNRKAKPTLNRPDKIRSSPQYTRIIYKNGCKL